MNSNIPPFYIGQKVVYITGVNMPKNSIHKVLACYKSACGKCWSVIIEALSNYNPKNIGECTHVKCPRCNSVQTKQQFLQNAVKGGWCAESFRPVQELKMKKVELSKLMEELPVSAN
jgi:hypothetical protein